MDVNGCLCIVGCSVNGECPIHGDRAYHRDAVLNRETVRQMMARFNEGIGCDEIGRQASLWYALMKHYLVGESK